MWAGARIRPFCHGLNQSKIREKPLFFAYLLVFSIPRRGALAAVAEQDRSRANLCDAALIIALMDAEAGRRPRREIELDFLRGLAILAVMDFHAPFPLLTRLTVWLGLGPLGALGVNVFFVLSGFLVGGLLIKEWKTRGRVDSRRFLIRRGFKIWPQYYLFLVANLVSGHRSFGELWPCFLNVQNYVGDGGIAHLWSLAVEEHAYLFLTLLLVVAAWWRVRLRVLFVILGVLAAIAVAGRLVLVLHGARYFEPTHTRVEAIFYGVMIAIVYHGAPEVFRRVQGWWWLWAGLFIGALLFFAFHPLQHWTVSVGIDMGDLIGVAGLMLVYRHQPGKRRSWLYRLVAWIGLYSYGIYLWHVSVMEPIEKLTRRLGRPWSEVAAGVVVPVAGIALGVMMTKLVEFPMLRLRDRWFPRKVGSAVEDTPAETAALAT